MSRTLSIGKTGLAPGFPGSGPSSISTLLRRPRRVSDARLCSLISARGASATGQSVTLQLGYLGRFDSLVSRVAPWARSQKGHQGSPQQPRIRTAGWDGSRYVGTAFPKASRSRCVRPTASTSTRARGRWRRWPCSLWTPRPSISSPLHEPSDALGRVPFSPPNSGAWPLAESFECRLALITVPHAASTRTLLRCLLPALVMPPCLALSPLECSEG